MSMRLRARARRGPRPAPAGARPPSRRASAPPDGWVTVGASRGEQVGLLADGFLIRMADGAARLSTRRDFLRRAGGVGVTAGLGLSALVWGDRAAAHGQPCDGCNFAACGPSPLCPGSYCQPGGQCDLSIQGVRRRGPWESTNCASDTTVNCWDEHCCHCNAGEGRGHWKCCDCCIDVVGDPRCTNCPNSKHKCICRNNWGGC